MNQIPLEEIVSNLKNGDQSDFTTLLNTLRPLILSTIKKYGFYESFEENYQISMVVLLESIYEYEPTKNVTFAAFYKLKLFYAFTTLLKENADDINFTQECYDLNQIPEENEPQIQHLEKIIWQEDRLALHEAMNKLTKRQKWLIEEHFYKGKRLTQISEECDLHYQSLVKIKAKALKLLKIYLTQQSIN